jgi:hypothetical protein
LLKFNGRWKSVGGALRVRILRWSILLAGGAFALAAAAQDTFTPMALDSGF